MQAGSEKGIEKFRGDTLLTKELLRAITQRIVEAVHPDKIILFGSYAYGEPTPDSDIDLLVILNNRRRSIENATAIDKLFADRRFGMDILVRSARVLSDRLQMGDMFMQEILEKGRVLYERRHRNSARLGRQSRNGLQKRSRSRSTAQGPAA